MGEPVGKKAIEDKEFTLFYDYDELRDGKLHLLSDDGKIEWFKCRMEAVFLLPLRKLFDRNSDVHKQLNSAPDAEWPWTAMITAAFSLLLNGIEALGSFLPESKAKTEEHYNPNKKSKNYFAFKQFIGNYMKDWDVCVQGTDYRDKEGTRYENVYLPLILWDYFRNGIAHAFVVNGGGLEYEADEAGFLIKYNGYLEIGPVKFFGDFEKALENYFREVSQHHRERFVSQFNRAYPAQIRGRA